MPDYKKLNQAILWHVCSHGLSLLDFVSDIFLRGRQCSEAIRYLVREGLLEHHHKKSESSPPLPQGVSFVRPTEKGNILLGFPQDRGRTITQQALHNRVATLFYCCDDLGRRRWRLEPEEARFILDTEVANNVIYVAGESDQGCVIDRVYVTTTTTEGTVEQLGLIRDDLLAHSRLEELVANRQLGLAVLAEHSSKVSRLKEAVRERMAGGSPLVKALRVEVSRAPGPDGVADALRARRKRSDRDE